METGNYVLPLSEYGDLMTIEEWKSAVKGGFFIDYDGYGQAVKDNKMTEKRYYPSEAIKVPKDATHFMWYNR